MKKIRKLPDSVVLYRLFRKGYHKLRSCKQQANPLGRAQTQANRASCSRYKLCKIDCTLSSEHCAAEIDCSTQRTHVLWWSVSSTVENDVHCLISCPLRVPTSQKPHEPAVQIILTRKFGDPWFVTASYWMETPNPALDLEFDIPGGYGLRMYTLCGGQQLRQGDSTVPVSNITD